MGALQQNLWEMPPRYSRLFLQVSFPGSLFPHPFSDLHCPLICRSALDGDSASPAIFFWSASMPMLICLSRASLSQVHPSSNHWSGPREAQIGSSQLPCLKFLNGSLVFYCIKLKLLSMKFKACQHLPLTLFLVSFKFTLPLYQVLLNSDPCDSFMAPP